MRRHTHRARHLDSRPRFDQRTGHSKPLHPCASLARPLLHRSLYQRAGMAYPAAQAVIGSKQRNRQRARLYVAPGRLSIDMRDDTLFTLRTMYDGRAYIQLRTPLKGRTALATLVPGIRGNPIGSRNTAIGSLNVAITTFTPSIDDVKDRERTRHIATQAPSPGDVELEAAECIVAGGRGIGREGFRQVAAFARLLGAAVGATRVATDRGWVEQARQIGATGRIVHPRLYIACGISGAAQHASGMREAQTIIAINPDRTAPIFALADLGLLGDANQVLPLAADLIGHN